MKHRLLLLFYFVCYTMLSGVATAAITPGGIVNVASYSRVGLPNSKIAQGSLFVVFGSNLGPTNIVSATTFPLGTTLGGTSMTVTVGSTTVNCLMIYSLNGQVAAILPSSTPVGTGQLKLTYNGQTFTETIQVGKSSFGIFTQNAQGVGPAAVQNFEQGTVLNRLNQPIHPGEYAILYGTGLGPVTGDESGPLPEVKPAVNVRVFVGGVEVPAGDLFYAGRSGCCAGQDQVIFKVPAGVNGCYVSVMVLADGIPSNYATISISPAGVNFCSDPGGLNSEDLQLFLSKDNIRFGSISLIRSVSSFSLNLPSIDVETKSDSATAVFQSYVPQNFLSSTSPVQSSTIGACTVFQYAGSDASPGGASLVPPTPLDAGSLSITGPKGTKPIPSQSKGIYFASLASSTTGIPGAPAGDPPYLDPGLYTVNGTGGADVGAFQAMKTLPQLLLWTNREQITEVVRANGVKVTWTGGSPNDEDVQIYGSSSVQLSANNIIGAGFICFAPVAAGQFTVGPEVLAALPVSGGTSDAPLGFLQVGSFSKLQRVTIPNVDFGTLSYFTSASKTVGYK